MVCLLLQHNMLKLVAKVVADYICILCVCVKEYMEEHMLFPTHGEILSTEQE